MGSFEQILEKLEAFSKKYYTKMLIKGVLLFLTLAFLLFIGVTGAEYLLWLSPSIRVLLFFAFVLGLLVLGYYHIMVPIFYLFKVKKGIDVREASRLIGKHFPAVGDRLLNLLQLSDDTNKTDLLLAAIEQRSEGLKPLPFSEAVNLKDSLKYARYLLLPLGIIGLLWISGSIAEFFGSYNRVLNYDVAYEPPAPFSFLLENEELIVFEDSVLKIKVATIGKVMPETVVIESNEEEFLMQNKGGGTHEFVVEPPLRDFNFRFAANEVLSKAYEVKVIKVPAITDFQLQIDYPKYLKLQNKIIKGTGNVTVPEGSTITWHLDGLNTSDITFITADSSIAFERTENKFRHKERFYNSTSYELSTANEDVEEYERLGYQIEVIKDLFPEMSVEKAKDSLRPNELYFAGGVTDDRQVNEINLVYYEAGNPKNQKRLNLLRPKANVAKFYYTFPSGIDVEKGKVYDLFFEAVDNDALRGGKTVKSQVFSTALYDDKELKDKQLDNQESLIKGFDNQLKELDEQNEELKEINAEQKQNDEFEFKDKERIKQFLNKQKEQEELMEKFSQDLKDNLEKLDKTDEMNQLLQERLERQEMEAKKNQKLLEELNKVADKIEKEDLKKRLEELAKSQSSTKRNLDQLLELTKRYYVTEKAAQLSNKLEEIAKEQEVLSELKLGEEFDKEQQKNLNESYEKLSKELDELKSDNRGLKKPMDLNFTKNQQESIKKDQQEALEEINKHQGDEQSSADEEESRKSENQAKKKQKSAAQKMKELSESLKNSMSAGGGGSTMVEDAEMLRQILDNLITFSFKQEGLLEKVNGDAVEITEFSSTVRKQKELRELFEHVDDSLFALSLRQAKVSEFVNEQITEVYYNVDKTLESVADNQIYQAASYQQYVLNASNSLADFLADILENMQQSMMSGEGQGQGGGFQLPDIIKKQEELKGKMEGGSEQGEQEGEQSGESGKQGESGKEDGQKGKGSEGKNGETDGDGEQSKSGENGKQQGDEGDGQSGKEGKNGSNGSVQGLGEGELKELFGIYQEQQVIRKALEDQLKDLINAEDRQLAKKLVLQMEQFENELLENGITQRTFNRMNQIQHQLLKLENAALKQGEKKERESETNKGQYTNLILTRPELLKPNTEELEILYRQALPLRPDYQRKVKQYFGNGN